MTKQRALPRNSDASAKPLTWLFMIGTCLAAILFNLEYGSSGISGTAATFAGLEQLFSGATYADDSTLIWHIRLPRLLVCALAGSSLGVAGVLSQGLFRNSLASPSVLGAAAGASAFAALSFYAGFATISIYATPVAGMLGAFFVCSLLLLLSSRGYLVATETLLLVGFALNTLFAAITALIVSLLLPDYQQSSAVIYWLMGSLSGKGWEHLPLVLAPFAIGLGGSWFLAYRLDVLSLGEETAKSLGIDFKQLQILLIAAIAMLVGGSVSVAGGLPFVGLVIPHISRHLLGPQHRRLALASAINGASLTLFADFFARYLFEPRELNIGVLVSLFGAGFFIYLLLKSRQEQHDA